ncbi:hypothetical protein JAO29_02525 [Edaphobacter sp. HDX4]|uniref:hypothetical protein n=1 Tax=Edaphobacter sp. HDX4 TaxID=2794064 RepID=UPI002FE4FE3F
MSNTDIMAEMYWEVDDSLAAYANEAEKSLSALYHRVCASYGEEIAFFVAEKWIELFEKRLSGCKNELPEMSEITACSVSAFLVWSNGGILHSA